MALDGLSGLSGFLLGLYVSWEVSGDVGDVAKKWALGLFNYLAGLAVGLADLSQEIRNS